MSAKTITGRDMWLGAIASKLLDTDRRGLRLLDNHER